MRGLDRRDRRRALWQAQDHRLGGERGCAGESPREEPVATGGTEGAPVVAQDSQQSGRKHDVAVLAALALVDANDPDAGCRCRLGRRLTASDTRRASRVAGGQDGTVLEAGRTVEEVEDFLGTGDDGKFAGLFGIGNGLPQVPASLEGDLVEEAQGRDLRR